MTQEDVPVTVSVKCQECGNAFSWDFRTPDPAIVAGVKLAAREKRMREVAEEMGAILRDNPPPTHNRPEGLPLKCLRLWRAKLLEGIEAE